MEAKGRRNRKKAKAHSASSIGFVATSEAEIRKQIEKITVVTGSNDQPQQFAKLNRPETRFAKSAEPIVRRCKNINLYDDEADEESASTSITSDDYADEHAIIADIRCTNGATNYSNRKLERIWGVSKDEEKNQKEPDEEKNEKEPDVSCTPEPSTVAEEWPCLPSGVHVDRRRFKKNALISSLLKPQCEESRIEGHPLEATSRPDLNDDKNVGENLSDCHIIRDRVDPDFFYRKTTVENSSADFTVEHVGQVKIVGPRTYQIRNFSDDDIAFCPRNKSSVRKNKTKK